MPLTSNGVSIKLLLILIVLFLPFLVFAVEKININTASFEDLQKITGVGPVLAQRIIDLRPFASLDDLTKVKGIGEKTLQKIKEQELAYVSDKSKEKNPKSETNSNYQNTNALDETEESKDVDPLAEHSASDQSVFLHPDNIFISEVLPNPEGPDAQEEWIELYNGNNFAVSLLNWQIRDKNGAIKTYTLLQENTNMQPFGYLVFKRPKTKIVLNNDKDGLELIKPNGKIADAMSYPKTIQGFSYNRVFNSGGDVWQWSQKLTPGALNVIENNSLLASSNSDNSNVELALIKKNLFAGQLNQEENSSPWILLITALAITIVAVIIVLLVKLRNLGN